MAVLFAIFAQPKAVGQQLQFARPLSTAQLLGRNVGLVTINLLNTNGAVATNLSAPIAVSITGPENFLTSQTNNATNGIATFNFTSTAFNPAGLYAVTATSAGLTPAFQNIGVETTMVPPQGSIFAGAWVSPDTNGPQNISQLQQSCGRTMALSLHYYSWADTNFNSPQIFTNALAGDAANNRIPIISWRGTYLNAPAIWQAAGYMPDKLLFGWSNILSAFETNFPDKPFSVAIIPDNPFPPIDSNTNIVSGSNADANQPLLALAGQELPGRLVVQFNFLMTYSNANPAVPAAAQAYGTLTAYQSNNYYGQDGGGAACGGTAANPVPCTNDTYLVELQEGIYPLGQTNSLRSQYIEVLPTNVISFSNAIWEAHSELFAPL